MVGGVAQLGERCVRNAEVVSSILILSTKTTNENKHLAETLGAFFLMVRRKYGKVLRIKREHAWLHRVPVRLPYRRLWPCDWCRMYLHSVTAKESLLNHQVSSVGTEAPERSGSTDSEGAASVRRSLLYFNSDSVSAQGH